MVMNTFRTKKLHALAFAGLSALCATGATGVVVQSVCVITSRKRKEEVPFITQSNIKTKVKRNRNLTNVKNFATQKRGRGMR